MSPPRNLPQLRRRSMESSEIFFPVWILQLVSMGIENFMQQQIALIASSHHLLRRRRIPGNHNLAIMSNEGIPISLFPNSVLNRKRSHRNIPIAINNSCLNLVHIHFVSRRVSLLQSAPPNPHILRPSLFDVRSHILQSTRTISLQSLSPPQHP